LIQKVLNESDSSFKNCTQTWPQYPLGDGEEWPVRGRINYMFCKKEKKWTEVPYIQLFFFLRDHPKWLSNCRLDTQTMLNLYRKPPNSLEEPT
jgi:hypothetical protein